LIAQGYKGRAK